MCYMQVYDTVRGLRANLLTCNSDWAPGFIPRVCLGVELCCTEQEHIALAKREAVCLPHHQQRIKLHCKALQHHATAISCCYNQHKQQTPCCTSRLVQLVQQMVSLLQLLVLSTLPMQVRF